MVMHLFSDPFQNELGSKKWTPSTDDRGLEVWHGKVTTTEVYEGIPGAGRATGARVGTADPQGSQTVVHVGQDAFERGVEGAAWGAGETERPS